MSKKSDARKIKAAMDAAGLDVPDLRPFLPGYGTRKRWSTAEVLEAVRQASVVVQPPKPA